MTLEGKFFHTFCKGGRIEKQGVFLSSPEPGYQLVQYFEWLGGEPSFIGMQIVPIAQVSADGWALYDNSE